MRVLYTIPGWQPQAAPSATESANSAFANVLSRAAPPPVSWREVLRLDGPAPARVRFPRPERPSSMAPMDGSEWHARCRSLLDAHRDQLEAAPSSEPAERAMQAMLALLDQYQTMQERINARTLAEMKG